MADNLAVEQWPGAANYKLAAQPQPQKWPGAANYAPAQPAIPKWQGAAQHQPEAPAKGMWGSLSEETGKILAPMKEPVIDPEERKQAVAKYGEPATAAMEGLIGAGKLPGAIANVGINAALEAADKSGLLGALNKITGQPGYDTEKQKAEISEALGFGLNASAAAPELTGAHMAREAGRLPPETPAPKPGEAPPPPIQQNAEGRPVVPQGGLPRTPEAPEAAKPQPWPGSEAYRAKGLTPAQDQAAAGAVERAANRQAVQAKIETPAVQTTEGKVVTGPSHPEIVAKLGEVGKPGFVTDKGQFVDRETGAKIAKTAKQTKTPVDKLHSEDLKGGKVKKVTAANKPPKGEKISPEAQKGMDGLANDLSVATVRHGEGGEVLNMDPAQRIARAKKQGFNTDLTLFHGTTKPNILRLKWPEGSSEPAVFLTDDFKVANAYAGYQHDMKSAPPGSNIIPVWTKMVKPKVVDWGGTSYNNAKMKAILAQAKKEGHDVVIIKNIIDVGSGGKPQTQYAFFKPGNIRAKFGAAFDPKVTEPKAGLLSAAKTPVADILRYNMLEYDEKAAKERPPGFINDLKRAAERLKELFGPSATSAKRSISKFYGRATRASEQARAGMDQFRKLIAENSTLEQRLALIKWLQKPEEMASKLFQPDPSIAPFLDAFRDMMVRMRIKLESLPKTAQMGFKEDYLTQLWKDPVEAARTLAELGPKQGSNAFMKRTVFDDYEEGIRAGLVPKTTDPIELGMRYVENVERYMALNQVIDEGTANAQILWRNPGKQPRGWVQLQGRVNQYHGGGVENAYAPEGYARVYNAFVSKGPQGFGGEVFANAVRAANKITGLKLALSYFHAGMMTAETYASGLADSIDKLMGGDVLGAAKGIRDLPKKPIRNLAKGLQVQKAYLDENYGTPELRRIVNALTDANFNIAGRGRIADEYRGSPLGGFIESWRRGILKLEGARVLGDIKSAPLMGSLRTAGRIMDTMMEPLFQYYVPLMKNSAAYDMMKTILEQNPEISDAELAKKAYDVADTIDNRFGEMNHDRIFWQRTTKMMAQAALISYSYTLGTARIVTGIAGDLATLPARLMRGDKLWTNRLSYMIAMPVTAMLTNAIFQYIKTGKPPEEGRDLIYPLTGGVDPSTGKPARAVLPSYLPQFMNFWEHPKQEFGNKINSLWKTLWDAWNNQDWRGDQIMQENAPAVQQFEQLGQYLGEELASPIYLTGQRKGGTNISEGERFFGAREAPMFAVDPERYGQLQRYEAAKAAVTKQHHDINAERAQHGLPPRKWHRTETDRAIRSEMNKYRGAQ